MTKAPQSGLLTELNMALFADYYELTMGKADFDSGNNAICTENYFVRFIPTGRVSNSSRTRAGHPLHFEFAFYRCRSQVAEGKQGNAGYER